MTDRDVRALLAAALPDHMTTPGISREAAVAAGRRAARARARTRGLSVAAICLTTVAAIALPWFLGSGGFGGLGFASADPSETVPGPSVFASPSDSAGPSDSAFPGPSAAVPPSLPGMTPGPATAELSRVLAASARRILPTAEFAPIVVAFDGGSRLLAPFDVVDNEHGYYVGLAAIRNGPAVGTFTLTLWPAADGRKSPSTGCDAGWPSSMGCENRTGPDGEQITVEKGQWEDTGTVEYRVKVFRTDGTILLGTVNSNDMGDPYGYQTPAPDGPTPPSQTPPMTAEQLVELLLTPGLVLA